MNRQSNGRSALYLLLLGLALAVLVSLWGKDIRSGAFLIGDCPYYASAAVSLVVDKDLDLRDQLRGGLEVHQRQVALGQGGEWYPKHPVLLSLLSAPFYAVWGISGFLIVNLVILGGLALVVWCLCRRHVTPLLSTLATLFIMEGTFLRVYVYNFSPDLLATLVLLLALLLILQDRPGIGGWMLGLSVAAKTVHLFTAGLVVGFLFFHRPRRQGIWCVGGMLPVLIALALLNTHMFGSPTTFGYDRTLILSDGVPTVISHRGFFDLNVWEGIWGQLFDPKVGLLATSPVLLMAIPGMIPLLRRRPWEGLLLLSVGEFLFLLFSTYRWWATSHYGNRFLMVPVCLAAVPLALGLEWVCRKWAVRALPHNLSTAGSRGA